MQNEVPRGEHPRPQLKRESWETLNGLWEFDFDFSKSGLERGKWKEGEYPYEILIPFCPESRLSGIVYTDFIPAVWYRRTFRLSRDKMKGKILLHFGAVDYECRVWINEREAGMHKGGYTSFTFDISALVMEGENTIVVYAADDMKNGRQASGKQSHRYESHGCFYTRTTGIWQSVWLEYVPNSYIKGLKINTDALNGIVDITARLEEGEGAKLTFLVKRDGKYEKKESVLAGHRQAVCFLKMENPSLWSPESPNLYEMEIILEKDGMTDRVESYFGIRTIEWKNHGFYLNGEPLFQRLVLEQGFYPEGIYTAPTEEDLIRDIRLAKELGFNGARLHEKVFEERYLYHADRLGYMVWGEYADWGLDITDARGLEIILPEWMEVLERDYNHPAIIGWCPFNETFDYPVDNPRRTQDDEVIRSLYHVTKTLDPTRPVIDTSGFYHVETDIYDLHDYEQYPEVFQERYGSLEPGQECYDEKEGRQHYDGRQPLFMSEYGGTFWAENEEDRKSFQQDEGWKRWKNPESAEEVCERYTGLTEVLLNSSAFCGFCYTQLTDIEQEKNGLYTYDRRKKFPEAFYQRIYRVNTQKAICEKNKK